MDYQALVERAMKGVVRDALLKVSEDGLPGQHHLYITFRTQDEGVEITDRLLTQYPEEMAIVLQYQFSGLKVLSDAFEITLSFSGTNERLYIPFESVVGFADPSVNFGLQFNATSDEEFEDTSRGELQDIAAPDENPSEGAEQKTGEIVALDAFRKKKT
jgi:hypothetical protein